MVITFKCSCGKALKADEQNAGKRAKCPACGAVLTIPKPLVSQAVAAETVEHSPSGGGHREAGRTTQATHRQVARPRTTSARPLMCRLGFHNWGGCKCQRCGTKHDEEHNWNGCTCTICSKKRNAEHHWNGCTCDICGWIRNEGHRWERCKCVKCGRAMGTDGWNVDGHTRTLEVDCHTWGESTCQVCGTPVPPEVRARRWAKPLKDAQNYNSLAAYMCAGFVNLGEDSSLWNHKRSCAEHALREAGSDALGAMLAELDKGKMKDSALARIIVEIGDPTAIPLLKRLSDGGAWDSCGGIWHFKELLEKYPQYQGEVEKVSCAICGKVRPVTETKRCSDKRFCEGRCWSMRGRVIKHGVGSDCPHYSEGVCMAGGRDTGLCSLVSGSYRTNCHVYALHPV